MPLKGVPKSISPELLYAIARMGHGDQLVLADANFPSDSVAKSCIISEPIRVLALMMDRVDSDKARDLYVEAYSTTENAVAPHSSLPVEYLERFSFYEQAKKSFVVVQTSDARLYANVIVSKGVIS